MNEKSSITQAEGLTLDHYQAEALKADKQPGTSLGFPLLGLFGETGTLLSVVKKKQRDSASYLGYTPHVVEELGDVLWYLAIVTHRGGLRLSDVANNLERGLSDWQESGNLTLRFRDLQSAPGEQKLEPTPEFENTLLALAGEVGVVLSGFQTRRFENNQASLKGALVAVMRKLVTSAEEAGVTLEAAAERNLKKIFDRWPVERVYPAPLDHAAVQYEQLPRSLTIDVFEREVGGKLYVFQRSNGIYIGDRLTDNAVEPDDYRFHDVFHYAYCAVLQVPVTGPYFVLSVKAAP